MPSTSTQRRWTVRSGLAAAVSCAAVALVAVAVPSAQAATAVPSALPAAQVNPYAPAFQHAYRHGAVPTRQSASSMHAWHAAHPAAITAELPTTWSSAAASTGSVSPSAHPRCTWCSGAPSGAPRDRRQRQHSPSPATPWARRRKLQKMFKGLGTGGELWSGVMTQYCEGVARGTQICPAGTHVGYPTGGALAGVWYDNAGGSPTSAHRHRARAEAVAAASHFGNTTAGRQPHRAVRHPLPDRYHTRTASTRRPAGSAPGTTGTVTPP